MAFSLALGVSCLAFFLCFGSFLGNLIFHEPTAGAYLKILSWLCPFLYISSTLSSILNGLGKVYQTFCISVLALIVKLGILLLFAPVYGMPAYFVSLLLGQGFSSVAEGILLLREISSYPKEQA